MLLPVILHSLCHMQYHIHKIKVQQALVTGFHFKYTDVPCTDHNSYTQTNGDCNSTLSQRMTRCWIGIRIGNINDQK